jgi:hypothetical protein
MAENGHAIYRTDEEVINALYETGGNIKQTTTKLGLKDVTSLRLRINADPILKKALIEAREQLKDDAEGVISRTIRGRNKQQAIDAAKWYLPRQAKDRGYGDVVHTVNLNANLNAEYDWSKISLEERKQLLEKINSVRRTDA